MGGGNASSFIYGQAANQSQSMYDQLSQINILGILGETFSIFVPSMETLEAHQRRDHENFKKDMSALYKKLTNMDDKVVEELLEIKQDRNSQVDQENRAYEEITRLDSMKINSMEIIISFQ